MYFSATNRNSELLMKQVFQFVWSNFELSFWITALILLFVIEPSGEHFTLCPISNLGFNFCPGCGLGHSIHHAMWFDFGNSFASHPLGIAAFIIIVLRIFKLIFKPIKQYNYE